MSIKTKNIFDKIRRNNPYFEDFITRSIYNSNAIEGNTLSYAETYAIIFNSNDIKINSTPREIYEAINLKYAFSYVLSNLDKDLSLALVKDLGVFVNKNIGDIDGFRTTQVYIRGAVHIPPHPSQVSRLLSELIYKDGKQKYEDIFNYVARFHIIFERIHPFTDGNGRVGRLLISRELLKRGYAPVVIPLEYRASYMNYLANQDIIGLSNMLRMLNKFEEERMDSFGIKL